MSSTPTSRRNVTSAAGAGLVAAALVMATGAALLQASGANPDAAAIDGDITTYLADVDAAQGLAMTNLWTWLGGVWAYLLAGLAATLYLPAGWMRLASRAGLTAGVAVVSVAYTGWLTVPAFIAPAWVDSGSDELALVGQVVLWWVYAADTVATFGILGVGIGIGAVAAARSWAPTWLGWAGWTTLIAGLLSMVPWVWETASWLILPVIVLGLVTTISTGVLMIRHQPPRIAS